MLNISIIIPIFNGLHFTKICLKSLFETCKIGELEANISVVIIDDNSSDGSYEWIKNNYPQVFLVKGDGNLWWSGGINAGLKYAQTNLKADYLVWWNNDIVPDEHYFDNLIQILQKSDVNTIMGSKIYLDADKSIVWSMGGIFNPKTGSRYMEGMGMPDSEDFNKIKEVDWLPGMGTITHRSIYEKIGFVDDRRFPQYHGDSDFTFRAKKSGCKIEVYPELTIFNDTTNSGIKHNDSFKKLMESLISLKSNNNIKKDLMFYNLHAESILAYSHLVDKYFRYIGGVIKWRIFKLFGKPRMK